MKKRHPVPWSLALCALAILPMALAGCGGSAKSTEAHEAAVADVAKPALKAKEAVVSRDTSQESGGSTAAIQKASQEERYLFTLFWKSEDEQTRAMRTTLDQAMENLADRADSVSVQITDPAERAVVDKYGLDRAPMPLVLALAPNGAVTGAFPTKLEEEELLDAFATPCTQACMKHLQDGKLVFLCVQNKDTNSNDSALKGVRDFKDDERFAGATEIVMLDPADAGEASFLADLKIPSEAEEAMTAFLVPPGSPIGMFEGATTKDQLVDLLMKASSCGPGGCGPGGCGPGGCAPK